MANENCSCTRMSETDKQIDIVCLECGEVILVDYETGCLPWIAERAEAIVTALHGQECSQNPLFVNVIQGKEQRYLLV